MAKRIPHLFRIALDRTNSVSWFLGKITAEQA